MGVAPLKKNGLSFRQCLSFVERKVQQGTQLIKLLKMKQDGQQRPGSTKSRSIERHRIYTIHLIKGTRNIAIQVATASDNIFI